ncbi:Serine/threonine-protein phosphatase 2A activator 1 [Puttea exsequens]|nr:Serine/threonine-protein phosphatase 2A activator 1 [Puttea exsequens]
MQAAVTAPSPAVLSSSEPHAFVTPLKRIHEGHDVPAFLTSRAYGDLMSFLHLLNHAMFPSYTESSETNQDQKTTIQIYEIGSQNVTFGESVQGLQNLIEDLSRIIDEIPPDTGPRRFGNTAFRKWFETVETRTPALLKRHLPATTTSFPSSTSTNALDELTPYFHGSFGSAARLDYGSGHELSFLAFLNCIWKLNGFPSPPTSSPSNTARALVIGVLAPYLSLIRSLIQTYTLEPAGSHGVWGLDDHSFLPYILGSAQLGPAIFPTAPTPTEGSLASAPPPASVTTLSTVERERGRNLYFGAIGFIHDVKRGPFWEHSPMLYDISGVRAGWGKINKGMLKMYVAEVLSKFPVVQHFPFGSLFSFEQDPAAVTPSISAHMSSQPVREGPGSGVSLENASTRAAAKPAGMPGVAPGVGTKAPWADEGKVAGGTAVGSTGLPPNRVPSASVGRGNVAPVSERIQVRSKGGDEEIESSMPPPTRAPWAKK